MTGAGGTGVATRKNGGDPVYMHLGAGGVGLGAGSRTTSSSSCSRTKTPISASSTARGAAGARRKRQRVATVPQVVAKFVNGVAVYHVTDKGVIAQADVTGVKFWPSDKLNPGGSSG